MTKLIYDLSNLKKLCDNNEEFIIDLIKTFKDVALPSIEEIIKNFYERNLESVAYEAHKMIPGISFLGVKDIENLLIKIEKNARNNENYLTMEQDILTVKEMIYKLIEELNKEFNL